MNDFVGRKFQVGDRVVYPMRKGGDMWLQSGVITSIDPEKKRIRIRGSESSSTGLPYQSWIHRFDRLVVVPY